MKLLKYLIFNVFISFSYCRYQNHQLEEISLFCILLLNHQLKNTKKLVIFALALIDIILMLWIILIVKMQK